MIPLSIGGYGLREGAAAWAFTAAGLGAALGIKVTILYAVLMLAAVAPGAGLLFGDAVRRRRAPGQPGRGDLAPQASAAECGDEPGPAAGPCAPLTVPAAWREAGRPVP